MGIAVQLTARAGVKRPLVQILVVVANIQMRTLKTEVGKGSTGKFYIGRNVTFENNIEKVSSI